MNSLSSDSASSTLASSEMAYIRVPAALRKLTGARDRVEISIGTIRQGLQELEKRHPGIAERLMDASGNLLGYVNIYLNEEDIRFLQNLDTVAQAGDEISIIPAIAGG